MHPSAQIRGVPRFALEVPDGWTLDDAPGAVCVVRHLTERNGFWVNVVVRHDTVSRTLDLGRVARTTWAKLVARHPDAVAQGERLVRFDDHVVYVRGVEVDGRDGGRLAQMQALCFAPYAAAGTTADLFQIVGTCRVDPDVDRHLADIVSIIASLRFL